MTIVQRLAITVVFIAASAAAVCQDLPDIGSVPPPPVEWGKIPSADLAMTSFPQDTNASAVILCNYGETTTYYDGALRLKRHLRIKILNSTGYRWGSHAIDLYHGVNAVETIGPIRASTFFLDPRGTIAEHKVEKSDIVVTKAGRDLQRYSFFLPSLRPGCIVEIEYEIASFTFLGIREMVFQYDDPVRWSEYRLLHPSPVSYLPLVRGCEPAAINEKSYYLDGSRMYTLLRWGMRDLPALRAEPYITTLEDYRSKVDLQMSPTRGSGDQFTWEGLAEKLENDTYVGRRIRTSGVVQALARDLTAACSTPFDKMKALYSWVTRSIAWTGEESIYALQTMDDVIETKRGNSAEINYLLVSLLRAAGVTSDPIIASTREHGLVQQLYPIAAQFNLGMARAVIDSTRYVLDATDAARPFAIVPASTVRTRALVIREGAAAEWVTLPSVTKAVTMAVATVTLDETGALCGTIDGIFKEYEGVEMRDGLKRSRAVDVAREYLSLEASMATIDSVEVLDQDSVEKPLKMKARISSDAYGQAGGELLYVNPHLLRRLRVNPFTSASRKFPVDYSYPRKYTSIVKLSIPDSFEVAEGVRDMALEVNHQVTYRRRSVIEGNRIEVLTRFEILAAEIDPGLYRRLREFYSAMIHAESEVLVLKKKPAPGGAADTHSSVPSHTMPTPHD